MAGPRGRHLKHYDPVAALQEYKARVLEGGAGRGHGTIAKHTAIHAHHVAVVHAKMPHIPKPHATHVVTHHKAGGTGVTHHHAYHHAKKK